MSSSTTKTRSVVITGASSGIGYATAEALAKKGYHVALLARRADRINTLANNLSTKYKVTALCLPTDVTDRQSLQQAYDTISKDPKFTKLRCLVNAAGISNSTTIQDAELDEMVSCINTNVIGLLMSTKIFLPSLIAYGSGAIIVNIGSIAGRWPLGGMGTYSPTKAFVNQFSFSLRKDVASAGLRVTDIRPGMTQTELTQGCATKKHLEASDVADAILYVVELPDRVCIPDLEIVPTCTIQGGWTTVDSSAK